MRPQECSLAMPDRDRTRVLTLVPKCESKSATQDKRALLEMVQKVVEDIDKRAVVAVAIAVQLANGSTVIRTISTRSHIDLIYAVAILHNEILKSLPIVAEPA